MKKHNGWSYLPYQPFFEETSLYISRIVPDENSIEIFWLDAGCTEYTVYLKENIEEEAFSAYATVKATSCRLEGLKSETHYAFYIQSGDLKSGVRLARTGKPFGTVVNYLHPDDETYSFSGRFLCSPSLVRHPDGFLLASMDLFEGGAPQNLTLIFRSDDDGKTWALQSEVFPSFWGRLFIHRGVLYLLSCSTEYGDLLIGASYDGGKTFTEPTVLLRGSNGKKKNTGVHKNPQPVVEYKGRIYNTLEWGSWGKGYHAPMVMSADADSDLLDAASWSFTYPVKYNENWEGLPKGPSNGNIEGCLMVGRDGKLYNVMRYDMGKLEPNYGLVIRYLVHDEDPDAPLTFDKAIHFPANHSKFEMQYDEVSDCYYSLATRITCPEDSGKRTLLSLMRSKDAENWELVCDIQDSRADDPNGKKIGYQYMDFIIEGNDILFLCRTAINDAATFHNSNYITFHRIENFRSL